MARPKLTITTPQSGQSVSNANLEIAGAVTDKVPVNGVFYQLNDGPWLPAITANAWAGWTGRLTLSQPGRTTVSAYAEDGNGIFASNSVSFKYIPSAPLVVLTNGDGTVSRNDSDALLAIGTNYTVKGTPASTWLFSNWVGGIAQPYTFLTNGPTLKFIMQSNLVLQANFVPNPFIPLQGTFNGLFLDSNEVSEASSGFFTLSLRTNGTFTGKVMTSAKIYSLPTTDGFDVSGHVKFALSSKQGPLDFDLQLGRSDAASEGLTGTVSGGGWTSGLTAYRAVFNAATNKAVNYQGFYTLAVAGSEEPANSPGGFGGAAVSASAGGLITMVGHLADGTPVSQSVSVSEDGHWPFYAAYPASSSGHGGAIFGWLSFSNQPATALGGTVDWFRPAGRSPGVYDKGFTNLAVPVTGSLYDPTNQPRLLALRGGEGQLTLEGGDLPLTITNQITLTTSNTIIVASPNTYKLALTITQTNGTIGGSFANPLDAKHSIKINGVLLQNPTNAAGFFLGTNESGAFLLETQ